MCANLQTDLLLKFSLKYTKYVNLQTVIENEIVKYANLQTVIVKILLNTFFYQSENRIFLLFTCKS